MTLAGARGARFWRRCGLVFRRTAAAGGKPSGCDSVRNVWPKTGSRISGGNGAWRRRSPARVTGSACWTVARTADRDWRRSTRRRCGLENDCAASRLGRSTRGGKFGGTRQTRDGRERRRRRRHPGPAGEARSLRAAALTALSCVRSRPRPACAGRRNRSPVRRRDQRGGQSKAACRNNAGGAAGVLACFARGLRGRTPAAPHLKRSPRSRSVLVMIACYDRPLGNGPKPHPPRARPLRP